MLKKFGALALALAMGGLFAMSGVAEAKGFTHLSFMGSYVERHPTTLNAFNPFNEAAQKAFPGKNGLSFDYFSNNHLCPEPEVPAAVADGRLDFGCIRPAVYPGQMNLLSVVALPGMCPNAIVGSLVTEELFEKFPAVHAEFPKNTVHFTAWASASYQFHTIMPVKNAEELKGKKIIVWDATTMEMAKAMGCVPIRMTSQDTYLALSKGMGDGVLCPLAPLRSYKITEATKHHLILDVAVNTFIMQANGDLWNDLPDDMKKWLKENGGMTYALKAGQTLEDGAKVDIQWMKDQGHQFYYPTAEERAAALAPMAHFVEDWKNNECKGMDPKVVEEVLAFARERSKFHTEQFNAGKYGDYKVN